MTVLGGAKESFLFVFGVYFTEYGDDINALYKVIPELIKVSAEVQKRNAIGIAAYKPPNSHGGCITDPQHSSQCKGEKNVFDFIGMLGIPLLPTFVFPDPQKYSAAFFSTHSLFDKDISTKLKSFVDSGKPILVTDKLKSILGSSVNLNAPNVYVIPVNDYPPSLMSSPPDGLDATRAALLKPFGIQFSAPVNTSIFPFSDGSWVVENFADNPVDAVINGQSVHVDAHGWVYNWKS